MALTQSVTACIASHESKRLIARWIWLLQWRYKFQCYSIRSISWPRLWCLGFFLLELLTIATGYCQLWQSQGNLESKNWSRRRTATKKVQSVKTSSDPSGAFVSMTSGTRHSLWWILDIQQQPRIDCPRWNDILRKQCWGCAGMRPAKGLAARHSESKFNLVNGCAKSTTHQFTQSCKHCFLESPALSQAFCGISRNHWLPTTLRLSGCWDR